MVNSGHILCAHRMVWQASYQETAEYPKENQEEESGSQVMRDLLQLSEMPLLGVACQGMGEGVETQLVTRSSHRRGTATLALG